MKISTKAFFLATAASGLVVASPGSALAQETEEVDRASNVIVVTARKNEESLLDVPVAVTAFGAEQIENIGLTDLADIQNFTPGFSYETFGTTVGRLDNVPRFRGIAVNTAAPTRQTASIFVDGIFVANGVQGIDFQDVERVEVIKGPQSAFFGRNTFGGAVNFITKTPGDELAVNVDATIATRDLYQISGGIELPIADWLKARISGSFRDKGGHHTSSVDGGRIGDEQTWSIAGTLFVEPSDNFDAKIRVNYFENDDGPAAASSVGQDQLNCGPTSFEANPAFPGVVAGQAGPLGGAEAFFCGNLPVIQSNTPTFFSDNAINSLNALGTLNGDGSRLTAPGLERQSLRTSLQFNVKFPDSSVVFSSLTGLNYDEVNQSRFGEGSGAPAFLASNSRQFRDLSQELRFSGTSFNEFLDWSIGGNYFDQRLTTSGIFGTAGGFIFGNGNNVDEEQIETFGLFGSLGIDITEQLNVTLEGRYQVDKIANDGNLLDTNPFMKATFKNFLPRAIVEFKPTDDSLLYLSYSEGNLPGGFNNDVIGLAPVDLATLLAAQPFSVENFGEETLKQYEFGAKKGFDGGRGSIAAAAYYIDRTNQTLRDTTQIILADGSADFISQFINVGSSDAFGVELEGTYEIVDGLVLSGTLAYIDSKYKVFNSANTLRALGDADTSGNRAERFPKWAGSISAQYDGELNEDWGWFARGDYSYTGSRFASEVNLARAEASNIVNLRLGVKTDSVKLEAFVTNLTDDDSPVAAVRSSDLGAAVTRTNGNRPFGFLVGLRDRRQFGLRVGFDF